MNHLELAKKTLIEGGRTIVFVKDGVVSSSNKRGVKPLLEILEEQSLEGYSVADKVIGRGAAFLYALLKPKIIWAKVVSEPALEVLGNYHLDIVFETIVPNIINHDKTGFCPIEMATKDAKTPEEALPLIRKRLQELYS